MFKLSVSRQEFVNSGGRNMGKMKWKKNRKTQIGHFSVVLKGQTLVVTTAFVLIFNHLPKDVLILSLPLLLIGVKNHHAFSIHYIQVYLNVGKQFYILLLVYIMFMSARSLVFVVCGMCPVLNFACFSIYVCKTLSVSICISLCVPERIHACACVYRYS